MTRERSTRRKISYVGLGLAVGSLLVLPSAEGKTSDATCPVMPCIVAGDLYASDQDNQVMDPGFERTPSSQLPNSAAWQSTGTPAWKVVTDTQLTTAHTGLRTAVRDGDGTSSDGALLNRYAGDARPGEQFEISGWVRAVGVNAASTGGVIAAWYDEHGAQVNVTAHRIALSGSAWTFVSELVTAPAGTVTMRAGFTVASQSAGIWYGDDLVARQRIVLPGFGLSDTIGATGVTQSVDKAQVQPRITGACGGSTTTTRSIGSVHGDGTVGCVVAPTGAVISGSVQTLLPIVGNGSSVLEAKLPLTAGTWRVTATINYTAPNLDNVTTLYQQFACKADSSAGESSGFSLREENIGPQMTAAGTLTMDLATTLGASGGNVGIYCSAPNGTQGAALETYKNARIIATPEVSNTQVTLSLN